MKYFIIFIGRNRKRAIANKWLDTIETINKIQKIRNSNPEVAINNRLWH
jgi:hypothetical protein